MFVIDKANPGLPVGTEVEGRNLGFNVKYLIKKYVFIYLAAPGLSCSTGDLRSSVVA